MVRNKNKSERKAAVPPCPKGSTGWMSHRPQSVNEPADPCNKLLGRTAELENCRHSQNRKKKKKRGRRTEEKKRVRIKREKL